MLLLSLPRNIENREVLHGGNTLIKGPYDNSAVALGVVYLRIRRWEFDHEAGRTSIRATKLNECNTRSLKRQCGIFKGLKVLFL